MEPNPQQKKLIERTEGIYLVDAGAGTGKTFAVTRRYAHTLEEKNVEPDDILLVTFTNNAAEEMKKKVVDICEDYSAAEMREAPISTFHSLCKRIIDTHGFNAPKILDINDKITSSTEVMENEILEKQEFMRFMNDFIDTNPQYKNYYRIIYDYSQLLDLIKTLASKGIFPTADGWFMNGEQYLEGNYQKFKTLFDEANKTRNEGKKQSMLRSRLSNFDKKCHTENAPEKEELRGERGCKQIPEKFAKQAFNEDREELKKFVHDLYFEYIKYALGRNYLNFNFLMMFAFVLLYENHDLRKELSFDYVMIDEFQDTSEIQFKLSMLLAKKDNICAVGDWKQSIYSFQYADVKNIQEFGERLKKYKQELNSDHPRINYQVEDIETLPLVENYRSTQKILDFSEQSLTLEATQRENLNQEKIQQKIEPLKATERSEPTEIKAFESEKEKETILEKIQEIVENPEYKVGKENLRKPKYSDIVVLTRTSKFGLELQKKAREYNIPVVYEGGTEIFKTDASIILLAWLRILNYKHSKRGWAVVLEEGGYTLGEVKRIVRECSYPGEMVDFLDELRECENVSAVARKVFNKYGVNNAFADKLIDVLQSTFNNSYMNLGGLIQFIEDNIQSRSRYDVDNTPKKNVVKVRTIHAEKGLEHPIVIISNINTQNFPSTRGRSMAIKYEDPIGLRQKKKYCDEETPYVYDNWKTEIISKCLAGEYDEERRLMYVSMTRAKRYLYFTADSEKASNFFKKLNVESEVIDPELERIEKEEAEPKKLETGKPSRRTPLKRGVHSLMKEPEPEEVGKGKEYGRKIHWFAEKYASGEDVQLEDDEYGDSENVKEFIDGLEGELIPEENCLLPLETEERKITLSGVIDLIHVRNDSIQIFDYKTDRKRDYEQEYRKQLSVYYHVLNEVYEEKEVTANIFYSAEGETSPITPLSKEELKKNL